MVERSVATLVQFCCMSRFLQRRGRVSDFGLGGLGFIPSRGIGDTHFFTCYRKLVILFILQSCCP